MTSNRISENHYPCVDPPFSSQIEATEYARQEERYRTSIYHCVEGHFHVAGADQ